MWESMDMLEHIGNGTPPPLDLEAMQELREQFLDPTSDKGVLRTKLAGMKKAFQGRGDVKKWNDDILDEIDDCFIKQFMPDGQLTPVAFVPGNLDYINGFIKYYEAVDDILRANKDKVPEYAREYFAYYAIWELQGFDFPMPLGTRSVIYCMHLLLMDYQAGFQEVSIRADVELTADRVSSYARSS